jgi:hypothetical protein
MPAGPHARYERRCELAARNQADDECAEAKALMHVQRKYRHCQADHEERNENNPHDRQQRRDRALCSSLYVHGRTS